MNPLVTIHRSHRHPCNRHHPRLVWTRGILYPLLVLQLIVLLLRGFDLLVVDLLSLGGRGLLLL